MKRVFISQLDTHVGRTLSLLFKATEEFDVCGTVRSGAAPIPGVHHISGSYRDDPVDFKKEVLSADVIICVVTDDAVEGEAATKILRNTLFDTEKTLVFVSSVLSWGNTIVSRKAEAKAAREAERAALIAEGEAVEDEVDEPEEEEEAPVLTEAEYQGRVPHERYQHLKDIEINVKQANSDTLHTHVVFAGMTYGEGEDALKAAFLAAWHQRPTPLYTAGANVIPMIHVLDLASIVFKLATSPDLIDQRYMVAVDRSASTLGSVIQTIATKVGTGALDVLTPQRTAPLKHAPFFNMDLRLEPQAVFDIHPEDEWVAPNGFVEAFERVAREFRAQNQLKPVRAVVVGPPQVGKSSVADQLAAEYRVPRLTVHTIITDYKEYLKELEAELGRHRALRRRERARAAYELAQVEALEAKAVTDAEEDEDRDEEAPEEDDAEDDVSEIAYDNDGSHLLPPDEAEGDEGEDGDEGEQEAADETPAEEDDEDDEVAALLLEKIAKTKEVLALTLREGMPPATEDGDEDAEEQEEEPPLPPGVRLRFVDEALAAMARWRLQEKDCLNQGYVLDGFPKNVRQAHLLFQAEDVNLPSVDECREREQEPLGVMDPSEAAAPVDPRLLPDVAIHLYADDELLLTRVSVNDPRTTMGNFVKRLKLYKSNHDPSKLIEASLLTWLQTITTVEPEGEDPAAFPPRQLFYVDVPAAGLISSTTRDRTMETARSAVGARQFKTPTVVEMHRAEVDQAHTAEIERIRDEKAVARRAEQEAAEVEARLKQRAAHERRYQSIAEEKELAKAISAMPMETYLSQYVLVPMSKGVERVIKMRPDDPINALADYLFEYAPRKEL